MVQPIARESNFFFSRAILLHKHSIQFFGVLHFLSVVVPASFINKKISAMNLFSHSTLYDLEFRTLVHVNRIK